MAIISVGYESNLPLNFSAYVTSSAVISQNLNENFEVIDYEQPIGSFFVDINPPRYSKKHTRFYPMWFAINAPRDVIEFTIWDMSTNLPISVNCEVVLNVLFQNLRMQ